MRKGAEVFSHWQTFVMERVLQSFYDLHNMTSAIVDLQKGCFLKRPKFCSEKTISLRSGRAWNNDMMQRGQPPEDTCPTSKAYVDSYPS